MLPALSLIAESGRPLDGPLLTPGESVRVTVLSTDDDGRLVILVKGTPLTAVSEVGTIPPGQVLTARVELLDGRLALRLEPAAGVAAGAAEAGGARDETVGESLARLLAAFGTAGDEPALTPQLRAELLALTERLALPSGPLSAERVREAVLTLGLQHEHDLALRLLERGSLAGEPGATTLKAWVLAALAQLTPEGRDGAPVWAGHLERLAHALERMQALTVLKDGQGQPLLFELALAWGGASPARLYVEERAGKGQSGRDDGRRWSLATVLELDGLGPVRVNAVLAGRRIGARLLVERPEVERAVAALLPLLLEGLAAQGFEVEALTAGLADLATLRGEDLRARTLSGRALVNVRV